MRGPRAGERERESRPSTDAVAHRRGFVGPSAVGLPGVNPHRERLRRCVHSGRDETVRDYGVSDEAYSDAVPRETSAAREPDGPREPNGSADGPREPNGAAAPVPADAGVVADSFGATIPLQADPSDPAADEQGVQTTVVAADEEPAKATAEGGAVTQEPDEASGELDPDTAFDASVSGGEDDPPLAMEAKRAVQVLNPSGSVTMPRPGRPRIMCVANQKGGVGKTTTAVNLAVALALHGNRVMVVDLDPQGNASTGLNVPHHTGVPDVYDCLVDTVALGDVAQPVEGIPNLTCVPATIDLAGAEIELVSVVARESRLSRSIAAYPNGYDYLIIDCPPSLGLLTVNALVAAKEVLIPIQCEYYALEGLNQLLSNINMVQAHLNPSLEISTILLTMYDRRTRLADAVEQDVRNHFGDKVLQAVIPRNVRVSEAPSYGQSVMTYDPGSRGATSYFEAALEIAERGAKLGESA